MPNLKAQSQLVCFNEDATTSITVNKAESLSNNFFIYLLLQVNLNLSNYKFYVDTYIQRRLSLMCAFIRLARVDIK